MSDRMVTKEVAEQIKQANAKKSALEAAHALRVASENLSHEVTVLCAHIGSGADVRDQQRKVKRLADEVSAKVLALSQAPVIVD